MSFQEENDHQMLTKLQSTCCDLKSFLQAFSNMENNLQKLDKRFSLIDESLSTTSKRIAPLHSLAVAAKALETRINRAVSPAIVLLDTFKITESLQAKIIQISSELSTVENPNKKLKLLLKYVNCVDSLNEAINTICQDGEPVIQKLQEVVEFLSRTKATDQYRAHRLRETLVTLKALFETEVDSMKFDGLLDEALLNLQDQFEGILQSLKHKNMAESADAVDEEVDQVGDDSDLGSETQIEVLRRISETLANNDCLDICIDIFVKVRYRRAAKALMRVDPDYLKTYDPEEIDEMQWEKLETSITLWIQHFELAVKTVLLSEKKLSNKVLGGIMDGVVWLECFVKIADKIMAVFFRFGEGVARSSKEPEKLFKLLDMFDSLEKFKTEFSEIFEGEAGADICTRFRELEKLLIHASTKVFWEFGLQIEGNSDNLPPPQDGSVPKLVRYAINYLKYLATENYSAQMAKVLRTEQIWKAGIFSKPEKDENLLKDAIKNVMEALKRNVESKRFRYKEKVLPHVFAMNTYWYIYMRTRNTELGKLLGDEYMKENYKIVAEESAYMYQRQAWIPLVRILEKDSDKELSNVALVRGKIESFLKGFNEIAQRHNKGSKYAIPDGDLREQIGEATVKLLVPAYRKFVEKYGNLLELERVEFVSPESIRGLLGKIFNSGDRIGDEKLKRRREISSIDSGSRDFQRSGSNASDL